MSHRGRPKEAPKWWRDRPQSSSPIERQFEGCLNDLACAIEAEHWFGDSEKHHRFRVDFLLRDARLIVELDGHAHHSTRAQREDDAKRQRYLTQAGYTVIRFTGSEVHKDAAACVAEVRSIYLDRLQRAPGRHRVCYIDYRFLVRQISGVARRVSAEFPSRQVEVPGVEQVILRGLDWLHERSFVTIYVFVSPEDAYELDGLDMQIREFERGEVRFSVMAHDLYEAHLGDHVEETAHLYDDVFLMGDALAYVPPLLEVADRVKLKLLRLESASTRYAGTDLVRAKWQDIDYVIAEAMGLHQSEW